MSNSTIWDSMSLAVRARCARKTAKDLEKTQEIIADSECGEFIAETLNSGKFRFSAKRTKEKKDK